MQNEIETNYIAFAGTEKIAEGPLYEVALATLKYKKKSRQLEPLVFDCVTSTPIEIDWRGSTKEVIAKLEKRFSPPPVAEEKKNGPGRPKLGVAAKEITLLPDQWQWLSSQPGGASVTLRKLVEIARKKNRGADLLRQTQEATYQFMRVVAGNLPFYEDALRALYAKNQKKFETILKTWPKDIQNHTRRLAKTVFMDLSSTR